MSVERGREREDCSQQQSANCSDLNELLAGSFISRRLDPAAISPHQLDSGPGVRRGRWAGGRYPSCSKPKVAAWHQSGVAAAPAEAPAAAPAAALAVLCCMTQACGEGAAKQGRVRWSEFSRGFDDG